MSNQEKKDPVMDTPNPVQSPGQVESSNLSTSTPSTSGPSEILAETTPKEACTDVDRTAPITNQEHVRTPSEPAPIHVTSAEAAAPSSPLHMEANVVKLPAPASTHDTPKPYLEPLFAEANTVVVPASASAHDVSEPSSEPAPAGVVVEGVKATAATPSTKQPRKKSLPPPPSSATPPRSDPFGGSSGGGTFASARPAFATPSTTTTTEKAVNLDDFYADLEDNEEEEEASVKVCDGKQGSIGVAVEASAEQSTTPNQTTGGVRQQKSTGVATAAGTSQSSNVNGAVSEIDGESRSESSSSSSSSDDDDDDDGIDDEKCGLMRKREKAKNSKKERRQRREVSAEKHEKRNKKGKKTDKDFQASLASGGGAKRNKSKSNKTKKKKKKKKANDKKAAPPSSLPFSAPPPRAMTALEVGMIRYGELAQTRIGEVRNPRIAELPSRTAALPDKTGTAWQAASSSSSPGLLSDVIGSVWRDQDQDGSDFETDTDASDDEGVSGGGGAAKEAEGGGDVESGGGGGGSSGINGGEVGKKGKRAPVEKEVGEEEDDSFFGAIKEGVGVVFAPLRPLVPLLPKPPSSASSPYTELPSDESARKEREGDVDESASGEIATGGAGGNVVTGNGDVAVVAASAAVVVSPGKGEEEARELATATAAGTIEHPLQGLGLTNRASVQLQAAPVLTKKKKRRRKKAQSVEVGEAVLDPRRPLDSMEVEQGQRLVEDTPLSLRWREYATIFNHSDFDQAEGSSSCDFRVNGVRVTGKQLCFALAFLVVLITFLVLSAQDAMAPAPLDSIVSGSAPGFPAGSGDYPPSTRTGYRPQLGAGTITCC